jgi:type II secretory pathway pseudopilin PulG
MTISIIAIAVTALIASLASAAKSSASQRQTQTADVVMRDYAEAIKFATAACSPDSPYSVNYTPPEGFSVAYEADDDLEGTCPATSTVQVLTLTVSTESGSDYSMQMGVRSP